VIVRSVFTLIGTCPDVSGFRPHVLGLRQTPITNGNCGLPSLRPKTCHLRPASWYFLFIAMAKQTTHQTQPNREKNPRRQPTASGEKDAAVNRNASHNYFLLEKFEAGVALTGTEVKSIRTGKTNLKDAYGLIKDGELWLLNCHIGPYDHGNYANHAALRTRKLLVHKEEIRKLIGKTQQKGLTLIPTRVYFKNGKIKVELALAKGKQQWDKRETERRRTADKEAREAISRGRKQG